MRNGQNFTKHPNLALLYYHCCSSHPDSYVSNDENIMEGSDGDTVERLLNVLDVCLSPEEVSKIQKGALKNIGSEGNLYACASCCKIMNTADGMVVSMSIRNVHPNFQLTVQEEEELMKCGLETVRVHRQCFEYDGNFYHLNPDLYLIVHR